MKTGSRAVNITVQEVVANLVDDLTDRSGFDAIWHGMSPLDRAELVTTWEQLTRDVVSRHLESPLSTPVIIHMPEDGLT